MLSLLSGCQCYHCCRVLIVIRLSGSHCGQVVDEVIFFHVIRLSMFSKLSGFQSCQVLNVIGLSWLLGCPRDCYMSSYNPDNPDNPTTRQPHQPR
jgi:hypothetical protein